MWVNKKLKVNFVMPNISCKLNKSNHNQIDSPNPPSEDSDADVEMFADLLANLLWSQWMYRRELENGGERLKPNNDLETP